MEKIQVLISTYNGEKYLREQLNSVIEQKGVNVKILVRDDGSTDSTLEILKEYKEKGFLEYYTGENIGYKKSFMTLVSYCIKEKSDYYAFCDQDDFWESNKLISAINKIESIHEDMPKLYFSNLKIVDENLNQIGFKDYSNMNISLGGAMVRFNMAGCTMVFNNELLNMIFKEEFFKLNISHDAWIYKVCLAIGGKVIFDESSYIKYRQHGNNVTGIKQGIKKRLSNEFKAFTINKNYKSMIAECILNIYKDKIPNNNLLLLEEIKSYNKSFIKTIKLLFNSKLRSGIRIVDIFNKVLILFRCY